MLGCLIFALFNVLHRQFGMLGRLKMRNWRAWIGNMFLCVLRYYPSSCTNIDEEHH
jgi:hypothetical protein